MTTFIKPFKLMCVLRYPNPERSIQCSHAHRSIARWPEMFPTVQLRPHVFSCYEREDAKALLEKLRKRTPRLLSRIQRFMVHVEARNLAVAKMNPEALLECGSGCLKWYECLPPGVDHKTAARLTGRSFFISWWEGQVWKHIHYTP